MTCGTGPRKLQARARAGQSERTQTHKATNAAADRRIDPL
jgi:hypothetical protein